VAGEPDRSLIAASILSRSAVSCLMIAVVSIPGVYQSGLDDAGRRRRGGVNTESYTSELGTHGVAGLPNLAAESGEVNFTPGRQLGVNRHEITAEFTSTRSDTTGSMLCCPPCALHVRGCFHLWKIYATELACHTRGSGILRPCSWRLQLKPFATRIACPDAHRPISAVLRTA
jgi:hypothetical protein